MRVSVAYQDDQVSLELPDDTLVSSWTDPVGMGEEDAAAAVRAVLEQPLDFPPVRQMVVPGDRVAIALDASLPRVATVLGVLGQILNECGVEAGDVAVVASGGHAPALAGEIPPGMTYEVHDPADRSRLAYLSSTREGRRIYLNRLVTDADVVIPVGRLGYDPVLGYRGPWSVLFPGLSDQETLASYRRLLRVDPPGQAAPPSWLDESLEVSWLLGSQFHLGLVPGEPGPACALAGIAESVRDAGISSLDQLWSYQVPARVECVVVGIGGRGRQAGIDELVEGLVTASRLVNQGGKIVAVSRVQGSIGPSLQRLTAAGDPREAASTLRGHDEDVDSVAGRRLAGVLAWADVYLHSGLDRQTVEDLFMVPFDHPDDASRVASRSGSCITVSRADLTRATVREERVR